jgi:hypothetical protein
MTEKMKEKEKGSHVRGKKFKNTKENLTLLPRL